MSLRSDHIARCKTFGLCGTLGTLACLLGCGSETAPASQGLLAADAAPPHPKRSADADAGPSDVDAGSRARTRCREDADCDDDTFCNGIERCVEGRCAPARTQPCARLCVEALQRCDCDFDEDGELSARCGGPDCDEDHDKHEAQECGGDDCDDTDANRFTGNTEVCDPNGHDEDCVLETVAGPSRSDDPINYDPNRDHDGDGAINRECRNIDPSTGVVQLALFVEYDCDDKHANSVEICDDLDNDCDGFIDEQDGSNGALSQRREFCRDRDGDGSGTRTQMTEGCAGPPGFVDCPPPDKPDDCDDEDRASHPGDKVTEVCDGRDNDCDGLTDAADRDVFPLPDQILTFDSGTDLECTRGHWIITACPEGKAWCDTSTFAHGCETNIRRLSHCQTCDTTACQFACGDLGCDEVQSFSVGYEHVCAVTFQGQVACWGRGTDGRLGNDAAVSSSNPVKAVAITGAVEVAAGMSHACAIAGRDRTVYCWGANASNQLGSTDAGSTSATPVPVVGFNAIRMRGARDLAVGDQHSCAVGDSGQVYCWGERAKGRLGENDDTTTGSRGPAPVRQRDSSDPNGQRFFDVQDAASVFAGSEHTCIVTTGGALECWGSNEFGQLGDPALATQSIVSYAHAVPGIAKPDEVAAGDFHTCVRTQGQVLCWGNNDHGQLGRPSDAHDIEPLPVSGLSDARSIAAGSLFTCAVRADGSVSCWGQLSAFGVEEDSASPVRLALSATRGLRAGGLICGLDDGGRLSCLGENRFGQLGLGFVSLDVPTEPKPVLPMSGSID